MPSMMDDHPKALAADDLVISISRIGKAYGETRALADITLTAKPGEIIGLIGHNGAGKSTLMRIIAGISSADSGEMIIAGERITDGFTPKRATDLGVRVVHQELSLCPNLRVYENLLIRYPALRQYRWRASCKRLISASLARIFPDHDISVSAHLDDLTLAQRQMVEIATAAADIGRPMRFLMLDEPTSALDTLAARQLFGFLRSSAADGVSCLLVSHRLAEIQTQADRTVVLRDGRSVFDGESGKISRERLVRLIGEPTVRKPTTSESTAPESGKPLARPERGAGQGDSRKQLRVDHLSTSQLHDVSIGVRAGEVVGLAGLEGHGQRELLRAVYAASRGRHPAIRVHGPVGYVAGDRRSEGVFPYWPVTRNISASALRSLTKRGLLSTAAETALALGWAERLSLAGQLGGPIGHLSGGNQQKAIFARALASPAELILLDDPTRGVDLGTKSRIYEIIRDEAARGRSFLWYSTETEELSECDRCYVLHAGRIADEISRSEFSEERVVDVSFRDQAPAAREANR